MKETLERLLADAWDRLAAAGTLPARDGAAPAIERTRDPAHGDFATNLAMTLAKTARRKPRELADAIAAALPLGGLLARAEIAGPGFINLFLGPAAYHDVVRTIHDAGDRWGRSDLGAGQRIQVEFVSANPTGPLHVGHGRGAAYGATLANLLEAVGYDVHREYYVNDAGRQMDILAASVWLRYLELCGETLPFPSNGYKGDYVYDIAATLHRGRGDAYRRAAAEVFDGLPADAPAGGDKEEHVDAVVERAKALLGEADYETVFAAGLDSILADIRDDLAHFGVTYAEWFSERSLTRDGTVDEVIERLRAGGHLYEKDGALWFRSTAFGDEKDRVVVRENGHKTYFASDIAYHLGKFERGFGAVIDIWGADHHGYIPRVKAALTALGLDAARLEVLLVQFAILYRGAERVQMSTRSGEFVTLRELRDEVGNDAARFFYVMRSCEQHMDFDLDLAKSESNDNPVYYVQYAHARIRSVERQMRERGIAWDKARGLASLERLTEPHEQGLLVTLSRLPEVIAAAARQRAPQAVAQYLRELAQDFHTYYNAQTFLVDDAALRDARLALVFATGQALRNGLRLLGVQAPDSM